MVRRDDEASGVGNMREVDWRGAGYWEKEGGIRERKKCRWTLWFLERGFGPLTKIRSHGRGGDVIHIIWDMVQVCILHSRGHA